MTFVIKRKYESDSGEDFYRSHYLSRIDFVYLPSLAFDFDSQETAQKKADALAEIFEEEFEVVSLELAIEAEESEEDEELDED